MPVHGIRALHILYDGIRVDGFAVRVYVAISFAAMQLCAHDKPDGKENGDGDEQGFIEVHR
jgi:hypothetical protein